MPCFVCVDFGAAEYWLEACELTATGVLSVADLRYTLTEQLYNESSKGVTHANMHTKMNALVSVGAEWRDVVSDPLFGDPHGVPAEVLMHNLLEMLNLSSNQILARTLHVCGVK